MFWILRPLGLALAGLSLLPLAASAVPIRAADGVATTVPSRQAGPRHSGVISRSSKDSGLGSASAAPARRGRPVPGLANIASPGDSQPGRLAEGVPKAAARQL